VSGAGDPNLCDIVIVMLNSVAMNSGRQSKRKGGGGERKEKKREGKISCWCVGESAPVRVPYQGRGHAMLGKHMCDNASLFGVCMVGGTENVGQCTSLQVFIQKKNT
jgi:hypothetical protein